MLLTDRDREILKFINEFGYCEMPQIEKQFGLKKPRSYKVLKRLIKAGFIVHEYILRNRHGIYHLTQDGADFTDLPKIRHVSLGGYHHQITIVNVYLKLMQRFLDATWISERRLRRDKVMDGCFGKYGHVADGMLAFSEDKKIAIEVELTMKVEKRLDGIFRQYRRERSIDCVWYYCAPKILNKMKKLAEWESDVSVHDLNDLLRITGDPSPKGTLNIHSHG